MGQDTEKDKKYPGRKDQEAWGRILLPEVHELILKIPKITRVDAVVKHDSDFILIWEEVKKLSPEGQIQFTLWQIYWKG